MIVGQRFIKLSSVCIVALAVTLTAITPAAFAGTRIGATCTANNLGPDIIFNESHATKTAGVITSWGTTVDAAVTINAPMNLRLKVVRPVSGLTWQVVGESLPMPLAHGANTFPASIPVKAGDVIGSWAVSGGPGGGSGSPYCQNAPAADFHYRNDGDGDLAVGGNFVTDLAPGNDNAIWAVVEPDVDADGFGDDTQDLCPQSASSQSAALCPPPAISSYLDRSAKRLSVFVTAAFPTSAQALGSVTIAKQKTIKLSSATTPLTPFGLVALKLNYSKALRKAIAAAPKKKPLKLSLDVRAGSPLVSVKKISVKLTPITN
jgi:hypothetical protein